MQQSNLEPATVQRTIIIYRSASGYRQVYFDMAKLGYRLKTETQEKINALCKEAAGTHWKTTYGVSDGVAVIPFSKLPKFRKALVEILTNPQNVEPLGD